MQSNMATLLWTLVSLHVTISYVGARKSQEHFVAFESVLRTLFHQSNNVVKPLACMETKGNEHLIKTHPMMTSLWCTKQCWNQKFDLAVLKGTKCWCLNLSLSMGSFADKSKCSIPCPGSKVETCGGDNVKTVMFTGNIQVYENKIDDLYNQILTDMKNNENYKKADFRKFNPGSCVKWQPEKKVELTSRRMTVKICILTCAFNKLFYALLSVGGRCVCTSLTPPESIQTEEGTCDRRCYGNSSQVCGGEEEFTNSIYMTGRYNPKMVIYDRLVMPKEPFKQNWLPFLLENKPILQSFTTGNPFHLQRQEDKDANTESALVTTAISLGVILIVVITVFVCIFLKCKHRNKEPDVAALVEEQNLIEDDKVRRSGRRSQRGDRSRRKRSPRKTERSA